jgi:hypothetical protein
VFSFVMRAIGTDVRQVTDNKWEVEGRVRSSDSNLLITNAATHPDTMTVRIQCQENALRPGERAQGVRSSAGGSLRTN